MEKMHLDDTKAIYLKKNYLMSSYYQHQNNNPHPRPIYDIPQLRSYNYISGNYEHFNPLALRAVTSPTTSVTATAAAGAGAGAAASTAITSRQIKMDREEIIIEHRQLIIGNHHHHHPRLTPASNIGGNGGGIVRTTSSVESGAVTMTGAEQTTYADKSLHYTQIIAALAVSFGPLAAGLGKGYTSPAIANIQEVQIRLKGNHTTFSVSDQQASWIASLSLLGALFGGVFGGVVMQFGRKKVLTLISLPYSLAWIITVFAQSVGTMFLTAFIAGFCCSVVSMVTQVYISEISSPEIRGFLSAIQKISGHFGVLISFLTGAYLDWRQLAMLVSIAPIILFITVIFVPETPSFLVLKGCNDDAYRSLQWLRGPHKNVSLELETIKCNVESCKSSPKTIREKSYDDKFEFLPLMGEWMTNVKKFSKNTRLIKPLTITCGIMVFQRFTGVNSFGFYAVKIFKQTFAGMNAHGGAVAVAFVQLLASMLSGLLIDTVGRIPLLITSSVFMSLALASFGSYVYYDQSSRSIAAANFDPDFIPTNTDWIPLLCVLVFAIAFSLGISPISTLLVGELFPLEYRGIGSSIATSFGYFCSFLGVKTFVDFQEILGLHGAFWLYACISCLGLLFIVLFVPETKGKDLDEMDSKFIGTFTIHR